MAKYIGKRILISILALFVLVSAAFFLTRLMPGSPFAAGNVSEEVLSSLEEEYGLNKPLAVQYGTYIRNLFHGELGVSFKKPGVTVSQVIGQALGPTALLGTLSILVAAVCGTLLGIWQAVSKNPVVKGGIFLGTLFGTGIPNFVLALLLALCFGVKLKLLPITGLGSWQHYILPVIALAIYPGAVITRLMCDAYKEEMGRDYVMLARAKGLREGQIALTHILKNAWVPVLNYIGPAAAFLLTGSFVVESIFTIPGLGREFVSAIANRDYTLILGLTVFMGAVVIGINLVTDLLAAWLNPGIRRSLR